MAQLDCRHSLSFQETAMSPLPTLRRLLPALALARHTPAWPPPPN
ncbi:hypothetical protein WJ969_06415 [Achromobacter xylosoxidans]